MTLSYTIRIIFFAILENEQLRQIAAFNDGGGSDPLQVVFLKVYRKVASILLDWLLVEYQVQVVCFNSSTMSRRGALVNRISVEWLRKMESNAKKFRQIQRRITWALRPGQRWGSIEEDVSKAGWHFRVMGQQRRWCCALLHDSMTEMEVLLMDLTLEASQWNKIGVVWGNGLEVATFAKISNFEKSELR